MKRRIRQEEGNRSKTDTGINKKKERIIVKELGKKNL